MYFETQVIFTEEIPTKNGIKEKKTRRAYTPKRSPIFKVSD